VFSAVPPMEEVLDMLRKGRSIASAQNVLLEKVRVGRGEKNT
jgi:hypothetical protein